MTPAAHHGGTGGNGTAACLLLVPRGYDAPGDLLDGLRQRGVTAQEVGDAPSAMVALASRGYTALIVVEPSALADVHALCRAVERYYPALPRWEYRRSDVPRLSRCGGGDGTATRIAPAVAEPSEPGPEQSMTEPTPPAAPPVEAVLQQDAAEPPADVHPGADTESIGTDGAAREPRDDRTGPLLADLTDEELAMLLDEEREPTS